MKGYAVTLGAIFCIAMLTASIKAEAYEPPRPVSTNTVRAAPNGDQITTRHGIESRDYNFPSSGGVLIVNPITTRTVKVVDQGAGCDSIAAVTLAHQNPPTMLTFMKTHRCYRADPGDALKVIDGYEENGLVKVLAPGGQIMYTPAYVFGENL